MLRISKITDYAIVILSDLYATAPDDFHSTRAVSQRTLLPQTTVAKVMKLLQKSELVEGHRGLCGGYHLKDHPEEINLLQVIEAIEGPVALTTCSIPESINCDNHVTCRVGSHWPIINSTLNDLLRKIRLTELMAGDNMQGALNAPAPDSSLPGINHV